MVLSSFSRVSALYATLFMAMGAQLPFWPLWLEDRGLSAAEVGTLTAAGMLTRVLAGVALPYIVEAWGRPRPGLVALGLGTALLAAAQDAADTRAGLVMAYLFGMAIASGIMPLAEGLGYATAVRERFSYGRARSVGSIAFIASNLVCGWLIARVGIDAALWWVVISMLALACVGSIYPVTAAVRPGPGLAGVAWRLARNRVFLIFAVAAALVQASHAVYYAYGSLRWASQGHSGAVIGGLWALGVIAEIVFFIAIDRVAPQGRAVALMLVGGIGAVLRWVATAFDPGLALLIPLQALHALSFGAAHLGAMRFVAAAAPPELASTARGVYGAAVGGVTMAAAGLVAAMLYDGWGGMTYLWAATCALAGVALTLLLQRRWSGGALPL